jgi:hypothetical protein
MKKVILIVVAVPVTAWVLLSIAALAMQHALAARSWPNGLGTVSDVAARYPERKADTDAALALTRMATPLGVDLEPRNGRYRPVPPSRNDYKAIERPLHDYVEAQLVRPSNAIDPPPPLLVGYFADRGAQLETARTYILTGAPIAWKTQLSRGFDAPIPNLLGHMELSRLFVADALMKARANDPTAWDDLHAIWLLDAGLRSRPDLISQLIAIASVRMVNAAAAKLPLPEPAWLGEVRAFDYRKSVVASMQAEAWTWTHLSAQHGGWLARPYVQLSAADAAEHMRAAFVKMASSNACDVDDAALMNAVMASIPRWNVLARTAIPNISGVWQRVARVTPEVELTEKVLQLRGGQTPNGASRCSDGQWLVSASAVKFSKPLRRAKTGINYPLEYASLR